MNIEITAQNLCKEIGEAPHWETSSGKVLLVDVTDKIAFKCDPATGEAETRQLEQTISYLIPSKAGGYMSTQGKKFCQYDFENNVMTPLHEVETGLATELNDGKCDASGRLWAGTLSVEVDPDTQPPGICALYSLETDGTLTKRIDGVNLSNGLAWTADNKIMFHVDTTKRQLFAYDFDLETGDTSNARVVKTFDVGFPDGMCIDTEGKLWVAIYGFGIVERIDPESGATLQSIELPQVTNATSCCFGGPNLEDLYVTTSGQGGIIRDNLNGGSLFKVTGLGVQGQAVGIYG